MEHLNKAKKLLSAFHCARQDNVDEARTAALGSIAESLFAIATELHGMNERQEQEYEYQSLKSSA